MPIENAIEALTAALNANTKAILAAGTPPASNITTLPTPKPPAPAKPAAVAKSAAPAPAPAPAAPKAPTEAVSYAMVRKAFMDLMAKIGKDEAMAFAIKIMAPLPTIKAIEAGEQHPGQYAEVLGKIHAEMERDRSADVV